MPRKNVQHKDWISKQKHHSSSRKSAPHPVHVYQKKDSTTEYLHGCANKVKFRTEDLALRRADNLGLRAYECPCCGYWHLTSELLEEDTE